VIAGAGALVRNRTGSSRIRGGRSSIRAPRARAPAEGVEPSSPRLTAGCPAIGRRWNERDAHARRRDDPEDRRGEGVRDRVRRERRALDRVDWRRVFKEQGRRLFAAAHVTPRRVPSERGPPATRANPDVIEAWFRAQDSNLRFWGQSPASCLLDAPG